MNTFTYCYAAFVGLVLYPILIVWAFCKSSRPLKVLILAVLFMLGTAIQTFALNGGTIVYSTYILPGVRWVKVQITHSDGHVSYQWRIIF